MTKSKITQIIEFYLMPNSLRETSKHFNISTTEIRNILLDNNIELHSKETLNKIQSNVHKQIEESKRAKGYQSIKIDTEKLSLDVLNYFKSLDALQIYWKTHSRREITSFSKETFGISYYILKRIVLDYFKLEDRTIEESKKLCVKNSQKTCLSKYGVKRPFQYGSKEFAQLMIDRYGVDNYYKTKESRQMTHDRCYGTTLSSEQKQKISNTVKSIECQERTKQTCLERYGVEYTSQTQNNIQKSKQTCLKRYGCENYMQTNECKNKIKQTCLKKYGKDSYSKTKEFTNRLKEKFMVKYGMKHPPRKLYCVDNIYFDSFPEVALYLYATNHDESIVRCPTCFTYTYENEEHNYYPDFMYNGQLIELKGGQFLKEDGTWQAPFDHSKDAQMEAKRQCALSNNVIILYPKDYKKYLDWFKQSGYKKIDFIVK